MTADQAWDSRAACRTLSPQEADEIFFPSSGGKPTRAIAFCNTCPIMGECLKKACREGLSGFLAGTTEKDRREISSTYLIYQTTTPVTAFIAELMPRTLGKRKVYLKIIENEEDTVTYLDDINGP